MCHHDFNQKFANFLRVVRAVRFHVALSASAPSVNIESVRNLKITLFISNSITAICDTIYCISKEVKETDQGQYVSFLRPPVPRVNLQADLTSGCTLRSDHQGLNTLRSYHQ